jgi:hypothetical protein
MGTAVDLVRRRWYYRTVTARKKYANNVANKKKGSGNA